MANHAVIVGIDKYKDETIPSLEHAVDDAEAISAAFARIQLAAIPKDSQIVLRNEEATRDHILSAIDTINKRSRPGDLVLIYYAGHGASDEDKTRGYHDDKLRKFLVPYDARRDSVPETSLDWKDFAKLIRKTKAQRLIAIFDSCYSGAAGGRTIHSKWSRAAPEVVQSAFLEDLGGLGRAVLTACTGSEVAREDPKGGHGVLTGHFLDGLLKGRADYNRDGVVDLEELWQYVIRQTVTSTDKQQNPVRIGSTEGMPIELHRVGVRELTPDQVRDLENAITARYPKLKRLRVAESADAEILGKAAAEYLEQALTSNSNIAVSCGRTLIEAITAMRRMALHSIKIYPLNGSPTDDVQLSDAMVISYLLWSRFHAGRSKARVIPTGIPENQLDPFRDMIANIADEILKEAMNCDTFLFGIGCPIDNRNIESHLQHAGLTGAELMEMGVVGEINYHLFDRNGRLLALSDIPAVSMEKVRAYNSRFFALSAEAFAELSRRTTPDLVAVAGGTEKRRAIEGALKGGFVRTLITDVDTAEYLGGFDRQSTLF